MVQTALALALVLHEQRGGGGGLLSARQKRMFVLLYNLILSTEMMKELLIWCIHELETENGATLPYR